MSQLKAKFASGALWNTLGNGSVQLFSFIVFVVLARLLTPAEFGIVAFASIFVDISRQVLASGVSDALVRHTSWDESYSSSALALNTVIALLIGVLLLAIGIPVFGALGHGDSVPILGSLALSLPIDSTRGIVEAKLRRDFAFRTITIRNVVASIVGGVIGILVALAGGGAWALVVNKLLQNTMSLVLTLMSARWLPKKPPTWANMVELARFSSGLLGTQALAALNTEISGVVIGGLLGPAALGVYRAGTRLTGMLSLALISPLLAVALPTFSRIKDDPAALRSAYLRVTASCALVAFPLFIGAGALASDLVRLLLGEQWTASSVVMRLTSLSVTVTILEYFFVPVMTAVGKPKLAFSYYVAASSGNGLFAVVASPFGLIATAASQVLRAYATLPIMLHMLRTCIDLKARAVILNIAPSLIAALAMGGAVMALRAFVLPNNLAPIVSLALLIPLGAILYGVLLATVFRRYFRTTLRELGQLLPARLLGRFKQGLS
jgi:PST family polysaccharide transporter